jgi:hypothetical protein
MDTEIDRTELLDRLHNAVSQMDDEPLAKLVAILEHAEAPETDSNDAEYTVFVGTDMEGDDAIYVKRGDEFVALPELGAIADELQAALNAKASVANDETVEDNHCPECNERESECACKEGE